MPQTSPPVSSPVLAGPLAEVRLELRHGTARPAFYDVGDAGFLVGSVPGCDLRLPGASLPPVICLITRHAGGAEVRKLAPVLPLLVNGEAVTTAPLGNGDRVALGAVDLVLHIQPATQLTSAQPNLALAHQEFEQPVAMPPDLVREREELESRAAQIANRHQELTKLGQELAAIREQLHDQYRQRRDKLAARETSLRRAARRIKSQRGQLEEERQQQAAREAELRERINQLHQERITQSETLAAQMEHERAALQVAELELGALRSELHREHQQEHAWAAKLRAAFRAGSRKLLERRRQLEAAAATARTFQAELEEWGRSLDARGTELQTGEQRLTEQQQACDAQQAQLAETARQLDRRYQRRCDRLAGLRESVRRAAHKLRADRKQLDALQQETAARRQECEAASEAVAQQRQDLEERERQLEARQQAFQNELSTKRTEWQEREERLLADRQALEAAQHQHQEDLVRLDRLEALLEQRQKQLDEQAAEVERRTKELHEDTQELEQQAIQLDNWHTKLTEQEAKLTEERIAHDATGRQIAQRATAVEGQQAMLATLRTRLERSREEHQRQEQQLTSQRTAQETLAAELQQRQQEMQREREELDAERQLHQQERRRFEERGATMETAVARLRQAQEAIEADEKRVQEESTRCQALAAQQAEQGGLLQARSKQLMELQERVAADRQALREREAALAESEHTLAGLQEQLRRRGDDLLVRERALMEKGRQHETAVAALEEQRAEMVRTQQGIETELATQREELKVRNADLESRLRELAEREQQLQHHTARLQEVGGKAAQERKTFVEQQRQAAEELARFHKENEERQQQAAAELEAARSQVADLEQRLPDMERLVQIVSERLTDARTRLREHLEEVKSYAHQSRDDLEAARTQVRAAAEELARQEAAVHRARDEHRAGVAAFRQQLLDFQGHVAEHKLSLAQGEFRLERREAEVAAQVREVGETSARLAQQAQQLHEEQIRVAERRGEVERHLDDMREWYRRKLRELVGAGDVPLASGAETEPVAAGRDILILTAEVDPGDRRLGDLLRSLNLVDVGTLEALLVEARKQRRSLRQALLASGCVTLYQMALIEAGNVDGLVLGPVRVVDRMRTTLHEALYRVYDPRRGQEAVLRHLAESEMQDAVRPDEFRQRFAQAAAVQHPHLAATLEVLEVNGRPAVLQEWLTGLPSSEWSALAAVPGAWFRLLSQAALGLRTAHDAGLTHGHLQPTDVVLTSEGIVKLCGFGEPPWLTVPEAEWTDDPATDLAALGKLAASWAALDASRKRGKSKTLPDSLQAVLDRLTAETPEARYAHAAELLDDLERVGADVPANAAAWERMIRQVRENEIDDAALRESA